MKNEIITNINTKVAKTKFTVKKYSPEILIVAGVIGTITSAVMACKATTKINDILVDSKEQIEKIHEHTDKEIQGVEYTKEDANKDLSIVYIQTGVKLIKLYAPSVALGVLSLGSIIVSNNILRQRNIALAAAYATVDKGFKEYRSRVAERFGEDVEREIKHNVISKKIDTIITDEDGKEKKGKEVISVAGDPNEYSEYARFFDDGSYGWKKDPEYNLMFLRLQQNQANDKLKANGHLYLNEVYDMLGIPRTKAGQIVGWVYDLNNPVGDNYVDFGLYDYHKQVVRDFVNGYERTILLDFNVDGNILDLM